MTVKRGPWNTVEGRDCSELANLLRSVADEVEAGADTHGALILLHRKGGGAREFELASSGTMARSVALAALALHKALHLLVR